jgi:hypothetical protein
MSQQNSSPEEDAIYKEIRSIIKPMINSALSEMPKNPVIIHIFISKLFIIGSIYDSMVTKLFRNGNTRRKFGKN